MRAFPTLSIFFALIFHPLALSCICQAQDSRTWTSRDGSQQIEAEFVSYDPKSKLVDLKTADDDAVVSLDLQNFSKADQRYITRVARKGFTAKSQSTEPKIEANKRNRKKSKRVSSARLFGISWTKNLQQATMVAKGNSSPSDDRPIFWFRVLGQLDGYM